MPAFTRLATFRLSALSAATLVVALGSTTAVQAAVTISTAATENMSCSSGLCTPTAKNAVLNVDDLSSMLASGDVEVNTGAGSLRKDVKDIDVAAGFGWSSPNSLTLDAYRSITFQAGAVSVGGTGAVALATSNGSTGGRLSFQPGASLSFASTANSLTINGAAYTLENSIATLASAIAANPGGDFALANSYDASQDGNYRGSPIDASIQGTIEGLGNTISNLSIKGHPKGETDVGLFADVATTGAVADFDIAQLNFRTSSSHHNLVGGLVGLNSGRVVNDYASGSIIVGPDYVGGLVGSNSGFILSSHASVSVRSKHGDAGGLTAVNYGAVELSSTAGSVQGYLAGGAVGLNYDTVSECYASGHVSGSGAKSTLGGLVGASSGTISNADVQNSYATGRIKGGQYSAVGGLIGQSYEALEGSSYSTGRISGAHKGLSYVGGFIGLDESDEAITSSYWNTTTSKADQGTSEGNVAGLTGLTTTQLQSGLPDGFDPAIWREKKGVNHGFPYLINNPPPKD